MDKCLACADEDNVTSIAFPSLGTGRLGYPPEDVANAMVTKAYYHLNKPTTILEEILLIIYQCEFTSLSLYHFYILSLLVQIHQ